MPSAACLKQKLVRWELFWNEGRREDKPEDLMDALPYADEDIFPNIRQLILIDDVRHRLELVRQKGLFQF